MNIDLVRDADGDVYAVCRETGERIQNVMVSSYEILQPYSDINSVSGERYRVMSLPTMEIILRTTTDIQVTQLAPLQPPPRPSRNPFFLPGMDQGQLEQATRELGLIHAPSGADSYWNPPRGPVFSEPSMVTAPADRISRELSRLSGELDFSLQRHVGRSVASDMISEIERQVMQTFGVPGQVNRNGDSISVDIAINPSSPVTGVTSVPFGAIPGGHSFRGERHTVQFERIQTPPTMSDLTFEQLGELRQYAPSEALREFPMVPPEMSIGVAIANVMGLERVNFDMGVDMAAVDEPAEPRVPMSPPPSLFSDEEFIPSLNEHPSSDEIVSTEEKFLVFDSANEVTQELIRMFSAIDMNGIANLLLRASLYGKDFVSEAWSGFTSHLVSEIPTENPDYERIGLVNLMCMLTPEEVWKSFTLSADSKNWNEMQWDSVASKRIREEMSRSSTVCISPKSVETIESLDNLV